MSTLGWSGSSDRVRIIFAVHCGRMGSRMDQVWNRSCCSICFHRLNALPCSPPSYQVEVVQQKYGVVGACSVASVWSNRRRIEGLHCALVLGKRHALVPTRPSSVCAAVRWLGRVASAPSAGQWCGGEEGGTCDGLVCQTRIRWGGGNRRGAAFLRIMWNSMLEVARAL